MSRLSEITSVQSSLNPPMLMKTMNADDDKTREQLDNLLKAQPSGQLDAPLAKEVEALLVKLWDAFEGSDQERMSAYKLIDRVEQLTWNPPSLSFIHERHGSTAMGSTRASVYSWTVNLDNMSARVGLYKYRQVSPRDQRMDTLELAQQVMDLINTRREHEWLSWNPQKTRVTLVIGKIVPMTVKKTTAGRRQRFRRDFDSVLRHDWVDVSNGSKLILEFQGSSSSS